MSIFDDAETSFDVVVNHEEQFSIWPVARALPAGWRAAGKTGTKAECLAYIEQVWSDMQPATLRVRMAAATGGDGG